ncbi:MAG: 30S ribosomal protein S12 methylthiotransferase RimO [Thermodesulfobacteria bacterium]|nr:30S ribosomal protein S12 methylthiotransferase RimO [Thermodesulfobacteriota bacterium]
MSDPLKVYVVSLGCPKNLCDTEHVLADLKEALHQLSFTQKREDADILLVNTCAFIEEAVSESIDCILELCQEKKEGQLVVVFGCLPLRYGKELEGLMPEVDHFIFHVEPHQVASKLLGYLGINNSPVPPSDSSRIITGYPWQVYVKIADGCSNRCTYCLIPKIRGKTRCRSPKTIVDEINGAVSRGAVEITLVAQDLTSYSYEDTDLPGLVETILEETDVPWLRLMYLYPGGLDERLLELMAKSDRICNYLDIPIQHASDKILKRMGRQVSRSQIEDSLRRVRRFLPDASLRTTVMVGFPGENEEDFQTLIDFIKKWRFHHLGCFAYSDEKEAASHKLSGKVPKELASERKDIVLSIQREISRSINQEFVGKEVEVLVDGYCEESHLLLCSRTRFQAPSIDGTTYINKGLSTGGSLEKVLITEAHDYDLVGEIVKK